MKILLADTEPNIRYGLSTLFEEIQDFDITGEAESIPDLYSAMHHNCPDLILMSLQFPEIVSSDLVNKIKQKYPEIQILIMSTNTDARQIALSIGADGFISKADQPENLVTTIHNMFYQ
jgi:DNA-binding NarL/FixJ family response regulator